jgi:hypothetical protein
MTRGAKAFGERGSFDLNASVCVGAIWLTLELASPCGCVSESSIAISAFSSNAGPDLHESILSPSTYCRQLFPGALIDRSCRGGRPGIVAVAF